MESVTLTSEGNIKVVSNGRCTFKGTAEDMAQIENGNASKELIKTLERVIEKLEEELDKRWD